MKSFLDTPEVLTYRDRVMAWLADGSCQVIIDRWEAFTGLKAVKVDA